MKLSGVIILIFSVFLSVFIGGAATKPAAAQKRKIPFSLLSTPGMAE